MFGEINLSAPGASDTKTFPIHRDGVKVPLIQMKLIKNDKNVTSIIDITLGVKNHRLMNGCLRGTLIL